MITKQLKAELEFLQNAESMAYIIAKEIESINVMISNTKNEKEFCEKYTKNFQAQFEYHQIIFQYNKIKNQLEKSLLNLNCISHNPINLN